MENNTSSVKIRMRFKLIALITGTTLVTALIFTLLVYPLLHRSSGQPVNGWLVAVVSVLSVLIVIFVGYRISRVFIRRFEQIDEVTQAWLRGNLAVRIDDPTEDVIGSLAENLDQLAGHL